MGSLLHTYINGFLAASQQNKEIATTYPSPSATFPPPSSIFALINTASPPTYFIASPGALANTTSTNTALLPERRAIYIALTENFKWHPHYCWPGLYEYMGSTYLIYTTHDGSKSQYIRVTAIAWGLPGGKLWLRIGEEKWIPWRSALAKLPRVSLTAPFGKRLCYSYRQHYGASLKRCCSTTADCPVHFSQNAFGNKDCTLHFSAPN